MKVLLLHPEDMLPPPAPDQRWDLVVDFGRSPAAIYGAWSRQTGCRVLSLSALVEEVSDLYREKELLQLGLGAMVDEHGLDWWDVVSMMIEQPLRTCILLPRLASFLAAGVDLYASRSDPWFEALRALLGVRLSFLPQARGRAARRLAHYRAALRALDAATIAQVLQDKFDREHRLRRRLIRRKPSSGRPVVLLPSAYINVSRTEAAYARLLPEQEFLLAVARRSARLSPLPANVRMISLDPYFGPIHEKELQQMLEAWVGLSRRLMDSAPEFAAAEAGGVLAQIPGYLRWCMAVRDAWLRLFQAETITACLSADEGNPYSRIPLILARHEGIPALACHHGIFEMRLAIKPLQADFFLAKGEIERDYAVRIGRVAPEKIVLGGPESCEVPAVHSEAAASARRWLVFFTEPYAADGWRMEELYRDLLPHLTALTAAAGWQLVFKLHPFENVPGQWRLLRRCLPPSQLKGIQVMGGPIRDEIWQKARCAITVESTVALECASRGIPVFLLGWLRGSPGGYISQFERFGIARVLHLPAEIASIPRLLEAASTAPPQLWTRLDPREFEALLSGKIASTGRANLS